MIIVLCIIMCVLSLNPIYSVTWLIISFVLLSSFMLINGFDFLPLLIIIVYVGAISVLFLFIVMMIEIKKLDFNFYNIIPILIYVLFFMYSSETINQKLSCNITLMSRILYSDYYIILILLSLILLIAMIGVIILTLSVNDLTKKQNIMTQKKRFVIPLILRNQKLFQLYIHVNGSVQVSNYQDLINNNIKA